jgi:hypothetical protein
MISAWGMETEPIQRPGFVLLDGPPDSLTGQTVAAARHLAGAFFHRRQVW